jgi:hypothetical protein
MKRIFLLLIILLITFTGGAEKYYVSATGNDAAKGTSITTSWLSIAKINASTFRPGDMILFKRGDIFYGTITINQSGSSGNPIVFGAYGTGAKPIITGFTRLSGWTNDGGGIYESTCSACQLDLRMLTVADTLQPIGRYPKITAPAHGYIYFQSHTGNTLITSSHIATVPNFVGGEAIIRTTVWQFDRRRIVNQTATAITAFPEQHADGVSGISNGYGFFFQNHVNCLKQNGDWMYDSIPKKIKIFSSTGSDTANVKAATLPYLVKTGSSYLTFDNINFSGCDSNTIYTTGGSHDVTVQNSTIKFAGITGIIPRGSAKGLTVYRDSILYSGNSAIEGAGLSGWVIDSNVIMNTATVPGMGTGGGNGYTGIVNTGHKAIIEYNRVINSGYIGIRYAGDSCLIYRNFVDSFDLIAGDGGGIYTYQDSGKYGRIIRGNIVLHGVGDPYGTINDTTNPYARTPVHGIYFDANASHAIVDSNTVAFCGYGGIEINDGCHDLLIQNNTFYSNHNQQGDLAVNVSMPAGVTFKHNLCFSTRADQLDFAFSIAAPATYSTMGTFDSNYYCRPVYEPKGINARGYSHLPNWELPYNDGGSIATNHGNRFYSLDTWQTLSGQDSHSVNTPFRVKENCKIRFEFNPTTAKREISLGNDKYKDVYNTLYSGTISLSPYSSVILIPVGDIL